MREYKFRGRDEHGVWHYGYLANIRLQSVPRWDSPTVIRFAEIVDEDDLTNRVDPETVGQKTGFRDSEGKEIFEGDVLEYKTWTETGERYVTMGEVQFLQGQFLVVGPKDIEVQTLFNVAHEPALSDVLIIGNVHDNPNC